MDGFPPRPDRLAAAELRRRRRGRNIAMMLVLTGLVLLFFAITIAKLATHGGS